ncbi:hypothetical protein PTKIN_Ptkin14bG0101500 [Pterospermum kingtungense]
MSAWITMARQAANLARLSSPKSAYSSPQAATLIPRRGLASGGGGTEQHGAPKVNFWEAPMHPTKWKNEQFAIFALTGVGLLFYGANKYSNAGNTGEQREERVGHASG